MRFLRVWVALGWLILWSRQSFAGDPQWVEVRSPNFSVITDAVEAGSVKPVRDVHLARPAARWPGGDARRSTRIV